MSKKKEEVSIDPAEQEHAVVAETVEQFNHQEVIDSISQGGSYTIDENGKTTKTTKENS